MRTKRILPSLLALMLVMLVSVAHAVALPDFRELAKNAGPAVVNISTERTVQARQNPFGDVFRNMPQGTPFDKFFEQFEQFQDNQPRQQTKRSLGSGFIISEDGYIVTNNHVIEGADTIHVNLGSRHNKSTEYTATLIGSDSETDLALLKIEVNEPLATLSFGDSDTLEVGEWLMAIGNPFGLDHSVTTGILSAKNRDIRSGPFDNFLQTDASINPGNSGGPLLNMQGEVIGINTAIIASGQGIGFAIPSNMADRIINQLKEHKKVQRGWIGVTIKPIDEDTARALGLTSEAGAFVESVIEGDPADKAGIQAGDILLKVDGKEMADANALLRAVANHRPGESVKVTLWRTGKIKTVTLTLGERNIEANGEGSSPAVEKNTAPTAEMLGVSIRPITEAEAKKLKMNHSEGLLVLKVEANSPASKVDIRAGDVILTANLKTLASAKDLNKVLESDGAKRGAIMLQLQRGTQAFFRTVPLDKK